MNTTDILTLFDYNYWAHARILQAALQITPEQFVAPNTSSYGSLRGTMVHMLSAEVTWRNRLQKVSPPFNLPQQADFSNTEELSEAYAVDELKMRAYLASLSDNDLQATLNYQNTKGVPFQNTVWHILSHMLTHGTQHRAEAAATLTDFGSSPGDVDMILYFREKGL